MKKMAIPVASLAVAFFVFAMWRSPTTAAGDVTHIMGNVGTLLQEALTKVADFVGSFGHT